MNKQLTKKSKKLKNGVKVYHVYVFDNGTYMSEGFITSRPVIYRLGLSNSIGYFCKYADMPASAKAPGGHEFSLADSHMQENQHYNCHRMFFSRKKALSYMSLAKTGCDVGQMFGESKKNRALRQEEQEYNDCFEDTYLDEFSTIDAGVDCIE